MSSNSCMICCENYNKSNHSIVCCPNKDCNYEACKECIRTYLVGNPNSPHCMNCKQAWSNYFMVMNLNKIFVENTYTEHRGKLLMEREKSKMPDTMNAVENFIKGEELEQEAKDMDKEITKLASQLRLVSQQKAIKNNEAIALKSGKKIIKEERKKFIMPCPCDDCRGFLSTAYKCEACKNHACPRCLEVLGPNPNHVEHVCNEDDVKTADLIKSTTKPCPKCGERISKIEGCDQMWCVSCHTAFSWKTGLEVHGPIHNPHFYQFQRETNNGNAPRNPGDVACGGIPNWFGMRRTLRTKFNSIQPPPFQQLMARDIIILIESIHQTIAHVTHAELPALRHRVREAHDYRQMRIDYILKRITEKKMGDIMSLNDKKMMRDQEVLHLFELYSVVGIEMFVSIQDKITSICGIEDEIDPLLDFMKTKANEFIRFINYCNHQLSMIGVSYNCSVLITRIREHKCSQRREKITLKKIKGIQNENPQYIIPCYP